MYQSQLPTESEMIESIYVILHRQRMARRFGIFLKLCIVGLVIYGFHYINLPEHAELKADLKRDAQVKFSEYIAPIVQDTIQSVMKNMSAKTAEGGNSEISPEMVEAVRKSMQKQ